MVYSLQRGTKIVQFLNFFAILGFLFPCKPSSASSLLSTSHIYSAARSNKFWLYARAHVHFDEGRGMRNVFTF